MLRLALKNLAAIPATVWTLGFVSLLMDTSSELIHSLLPIFLVSSLGASAAMVGLIEGIAEATALISKIFSGALSDAWGKRKSLILLGYGLSALTNRFSRWLRHRGWSFARGLLIALARGFAERLGTRSSPRFHHRSSGARALGCENRWTR